MLLRAKKDRKLRRAMIVFALRRHIRIFVQTSILNLVVSIMSQIIFKHFSLYAKVRKEDSSVPLEKKQINIMKTTLENEAIK